MSGTVTLHVGTPKSGTTSLQEAFRSQQAALADQGIAYLAAAGELNAGDAAADAARADPVYWARSTAEQRDYLGWLWRGAAAGAAVGRLRAAMPGEQTSVILSAENLSLAGPVLRAEVLGWFPGRSVRVVVTRRRPSAALVSNYYQLLRLGPMPPLPMWLPGILTDLLQRHSDSMAWWVPRGPLERFWAGEGTAGGSAGDDLEVVTVDLPGSDPAAEIQHAADVIVGQPGVITGIPRLNARRSDALLAALQVVAREDPRLDRLALHALMTWAAPHVRPTSAAGSPLSPDLAALIDAALAESGAEAAASLEQVLATGSWPVGLEVRDPVGMADPGEVAELASFMRRRRALARAAAVAARSRMRVAWWRGR
ncbi:MAG: hypothetical protein H6525_00165 [Actinobacteria bacterium]|nr:hypothetical protein [Actinomycetota bacterium]